MKRCITPIGGTTGIEKEDAVDLMTDRLVAVSVNNAVDLFCGKGSQYPRFDIIFRPPAMDEADPLPGQSYDPLFRQLRGIEIAAHRQHRARQEVEDLRVNDIAGMENQFGVGEMIPATGQQPRQARIVKGQMSVRENADAHKLTPGPLVSAPVSRVF